MVGVAVFGLLLGGSALADTTSCTFTDPLGRGNATLTTVPSTTGEWPVFVPASLGGPAWEYRYQLSSASVPSLGTNPGVDFLIPVCTPSLSIIPSTNVTVYPAGFPPGAGSRFGLWTGHDNVVRVRRAGASPNIVFRTLDSLPLHDVSAGLVTAATTASAYTCNNIVAPVCPGTSTPSAQGPIRSFESFKLGDTNCLMDIALNPDESIANASVHPFDIGGTNPCADAQLPIESIRKALICQNDGNGQPVPGSCKPKTFVEQNIIDKSGDASTYCYYTKTGSRVCKTL